ncbi:DNA adenine methylase [Bacteroides sp.]|uniref:DNA adenine methylase n=1 Tax=Bacteroides sp. TaxID=29523 RepID=UPI002613D03F|nr:DNA adenine methylase [Bacteroides sp.]MDD3038913.1 DNA adenine methylase [Bacteroides sp.]
MRKMYLSAPLPFVGQKRMFAKEFIRVLDQFSDSTVFVDIFGGSGLLSHITKCVRPDATVVYNDFDNYRERLGNIPATNTLLSDLRHILEGCKRLKAVTGETRDKVFERIRNEEKENGYVDYITLSSSLLFSMKYKLSLEGMKKETIYNRIRTSAYPEPKDYLEGLTITSEDYKEVFNRYKDIPGVVFLIDPPYLSTDVGTYKMCWKLANYLDVLNVLEDSSFVYFTSNKSSILELCDWIGKNPSIGNPFKKCRKVECNSHINYNTKYTDIMLYTNPNIEIKLAA